MLGLELRRLQHLEEAVRHVDQGRVELIVNVVVEDPEADDRHDLAARALLGGLRGFGLDALRADGKVGEELLPEGVRRHEGAEGEQKVQNKRGI